MITSLFILSPVLSVASVLSVLLLVLAWLFSWSVRRDVEEGRAVLITGCDSGFGQQLALRLDQTGFLVFAGCLSPEGAGARSLKERSSTRLKVLKLDVTNEDDVLRAKSIVKENLPEKGLWAVVNNAGISDWAEIEWSSTQDFQNMLDVNLLGSIRTSIMFLPLVREAKGRMVFVSSIFSFFHCLNMSAYSVSKRGLEAFADCLRVEMASFGVKVSIIQPGNFGRATNIVKEKSAADIWDKLDHEQRRRFNRQYVELAVDYYTSTCRSGFQEADMVIDAMLHAVTASRPRSRYLLVSTVDWFFFKLFPFLPSFLSDAFFSFSSMYSTRHQLLYAS